MFCIHFRTNATNLFFPSKTVAQENLLLVVQDAHSESEMALEAYASQNPGKIQTDVLSRARESCYKARDAFYSCLEKQSDKKPTEIGSVGLMYPAECKKPREEFVKQCRPTWVKHFDRQYCGKKRVQRLLDDNESRRGPLSLPQPYTFKPSS